MFNHSLEIKGKYATSREVAGAIFSSMAIYFFVTLTAIDQEMKEKTAHLYNAYQMGISINALIKNRIFTKGQLEVSYQDDEGENRFTKEEFQKYVQLETDTIFTLGELINDELLLDARDPTATRINLAPTNYDRENTKIKVIFDMVVDHFDRKWRRRQKSCWRKISSEFGRTTHAI